MIQRSPDPDFTPISPNPFIVGNPVRDRSMFFGREAEFELVRMRFEHSTHGGLLVFCGERRSGKTSILFQILDRRLGDQFIPVLIDMQSMAVGNEIEFLTRLSDEILSALGPASAGISEPTFTPGTQCSAVFQKFVHDVLRTQPDKKLILLFDEYELFENKIDAGLLAEDVLHVLASLMEHEPVFLIFTGSQHLEQRRQEYWKILGKSLYKTISFLERSDALNLIQKPVEGRASYEDGVVDAIHRLSAGQAFYTQAICQSVVDRLNEHRTRAVTSETLAEVVDGIVNNPLPQMIFMWDGFDRDEKLVLALLAEALPDEHAHAGVDGVLQHLRRRRYPLELTRAAIATACEKLFKSDMLLRSDRADEPEYAFRMDLWRRWIRRQHSVWQVMREEKIAIRPDRLWSTPAARWAGGGVVAAGLAAAFLWPRGNDSMSGPGGPRNAPAGMFAMEASPEQAVIHLDGKRVALGVFRDSITANQAHRFRLTSPGYADTTIEVSVVAGGSASRRVSLRELYGSLRVDTRPPGAEVQVDGRPAGRSPVTVVGLSAARPHRVSASAPGYAVKQQDVAVSPDRETATTLVLEAGAFDVFVTSDPTGASLRVDGAARGETPTTVRALGSGRHTFSTVREGYLPAETTLVVSQATGSLRMTLLRKPPGVLEVRGDQIVSIFIDGTLVVEGVQNVKRDLAEGTHSVRVVFLDGRTIDKQVPVKSAERAIYDFSLDTITHNSRL